MTLRKGHGNGVGVPRIEVLPADEQPVGVPAQAAHIVRRLNGTVSDSVSARELGKRGGLKRAENARLLAGLGVRRPKEGSPLLPYYNEAERTLREQIHALAAQSGGYVGPAATSVLSTAVLQFATSRWLFDVGSETCDPETLKRASQLGNDSRQNMLAARELAVREAQARQDDLGADLRAQQVAFQKRLLKE